MRILVTGAAGRLGSGLMQKLGADGHLCYGTDRSGSSELAALDITNFTQTRQTITDFQPDVVIHAAAWTDVDGCARNPEKAIAVNGFGTQNVALAAAAAGAAMVCVSSNEVFNGQSSQPYREYDITQPVNPYGYSKWVGERALQHINPRHYIVRTAWLFAHGGRNFIQAILGAAEAGKSLRVVANEVANPTYNDDLAEAIAALITTERFGIYHFVNEGACSRVSFARYALDRAGFTQTAIMPITSHEWPRASTPPLHASLENLAGAQIGIRLRPWQAAVDAFLQREGRL